MLRDSPTVATRKPVYDAAVVGAGIVGLAAAVALARAGHRIALVERTAPERLRGALGFDLRSVALTPASVDFLRALDGVQEAALTPIETMQVWEYDGSGSLRFECDEAPGERSALAFVAENSALATRLWDVAANCLDIVSPASVVGFTQGPNALVLEGTGIAARLVVGADGANSIVRRLANASLRHDPPYRRGSQHAIATVARATRPHRNIAVQRFGRSGPVALLPLQDGAASEMHRTVSVIWSTSEAESLRLQSLDDEAFRHALGEETERVVGDFVAVDRRLSFPVRQALVADFNPNPRILVIGDAARTLHPLAGQGVNVGLEDVRALVAGANHSDPGAPGRWRAFSRQRRTRSKLMMVSMRALLAAYCGPHAGNPWMRLARNAGVRFIDATPALKAQLIREAMGLGPMADAHTSGGVDMKLAHPGTCQTRCGGGQRLGPSRRANGGNG